MGKEKCPVCGGQSVFKSKKVEGARYCWEAADGCGARWNTEQLWQAAHPPVAGNDPPPPTDDDLPF